MINLAFLGLPQLRRDEQMISLARAKGVALLAYLAITRVPQRREHLLDLLWPESSPDAARKNMRNTLWAIREALGPDVLLLAGNTLQLAPHVQVDVQRLEDGLLLLESSSVRELEAVAAHYQGPLADGLHLHEAPEFELWLTIARERLAAIAVRLLQRIVALHRQAGAWQAMIDQAQRALRIDPLHEALYLAVIEAHIQLGQRSEAMQQYAALTDLLKRTLAVTPLPETTARYEALLAGTPALAPPQPPAARPAATPPPFVGRHAELIALTEEQGRAAQGAVRVVLIAGELGIGKSRLWRSWVAGLPLSGVLATHALETDQPVPFGPLLTMLRQPGPVRPLLDPGSSLEPIWLAELARLLPELLSIWPELPPPLVLGPAEERARLFHALTEVLRLLLHSPLVLVLDDLHWADPSTLDWLMYVTDHLAMMPLLVVGTYRPQDASPQLMTLVASWQRQGQLRQIDLPRLTIAEGEALLSALGAPGDSPTHTEWVRQSGGNPFFLIELSRAPVAAIPGDLAALIYTRLHRIVPATAYQLLQAAAVLGDGADLAVLRVTSGRNEEEVLDALDALVRTAILTEQADVYRFTHPFIVTVIEQNLTAARRAFLHRRAATALEQVNQGQPEQVAGQLMEHYAQAGELQQAAHWGEMAAAHALLIGAFVEATAYARRAITWAATPRRHLLLGDALATAGAPTEAQSQLHAAFDGFALADDAVGTTKAGVALAHMALASVRPEEAHRWLQQVPLAQAQLVDPALGAHVRLLAAGVARQSYVFDEARTQLDHADQLIHTHHLRHEAALSAFERGNLQANQGELEAAISSFALALLLAQETNNPAYQALARNNLAYHTLLADRLDEAQAHIRAAMELVEQFAIDSSRQYIFSTAGEIAFAQGELNAADAAFTQAFAAAQSRNNQAHMANVRVNQALVARARGDLPHARALLSEAATLIEGAVDPFVRDKIERYRGELG